MQVGLFFGDELSASYALDFGCLDNVTRRFRQRLGETSKGGRPMVYYTNTAFNTVAARGSGSGPAQPHAGLASLG